MKKGFVSLLFLIALSFSSSAQTKFTLSGSIKDARNGEELSGATVIVKENTAWGTVSNAYGFYSITLPAGNYTILYRYMGFEEQELSVKLTANITQNIEMRETKKTLDEVIVKSKTQVEKVEDKKISAVQMDIKTIKAVPALFGEVDILKTIQFLPGIQGAGEGNAGLNVRGGASDQNLILLDEAPVYNASHLMGFFSVFNSDAIKDLEVYKGGIPAKYGGRLSSLIDVKMREGNSKQFGVSGGVGTISSRLTLEGPTIRDKGSFMIAARRTYADMFLQLSKDADIRQNKLYFYDLNLKTNYRINDNNRIFLSGYFGRDNFAFARVFGFDWGNATGTLRWNHLFNKKLFSNFTAVFSNFDYGFKIDFSDDQNFRLKSGIQDYSLKIDLSWYPSSKSVLYFGGISTYHRFTPGEVRPLRDGSIIGNVALPKKNALESAVYVDHDYKLSKKLFFRYGLRYTLFNALGPTKEFLMQRNSNGQVTSTSPVEYSKGEIYKTYGGLEPRFAVSWNLNEFTALKGSYTRSYQFIHQASNSATTLPTDLWLPSGLNIKPQISDQVAMGFFRNFPLGFEFSFETYYKWMKNQIDYKDNAQLFFNEMLDAELLFGKGRSYGFEFFLRKGQGSTNGWVSYTLAWTERKIEGINSNEWYYAKYDRRHNLSVVLSQKLSKRVSVAGTFVYTTGNPVTFPIGSYMVDGKNIPLYGDRNSYRMPNYHRADISLTLDNKKKPGKRFESSWNFSIYNVYARENAYAIIFREKMIENPDGTKTPTGKNEAVQISLFKIIPSITWNFKY